MNKLRPVKYKIRWQDEQYKKGYFHKFVILPYSFWNDDKHRFEETTGEFAIIENENGEVEKVHATNIIFIDREQKKPETFEEKLRMRDKILEQKLDNLLLSRRKSGIFGKR